MGYKSKICMHICIADTSICIGACMHTYIYTYIRMYIVAFLVNVSYLDMPCKFTRKVEVTRRKAVATFSSQHLEATFVCRLDQNEFKPCKCSCKLCTYVHTYIHTFAYVHEIVVTGKGAFPRVHGTREHCAYAHIRQCMSAYVTTNTYVTLPVL